MTNVNLQDGINEAADKAASTLKEGGIVAYPTDTLYGLAVAITPTGITRLQELKVREKGKPISIVVRDLSMMEEYAELTDAARSMAERFLPGPLTIIVKAKANVPEELTQNGGIGMRIPDDAFCQALSQAYDAPYTATSANRAGQETPTDAQALVAHFGEAADIALIVDGGERAGGVPSTVVSFLGERPAIVREGKLSAQELEL